LRWERELVEGRRERLRRESQSLCHSWLPWTLPQLSCIYIIYTIRHKSSMSGLTLFVLLLIISNKSLSVNSLTSSLKLIPTKSKNILLLIKKNRISNMYPFYKPSSKKHVINKNHCLKKYNPLKR
jgi:hypothetical protein